MHDRAISKQPIIGFDIPPSAPAAVAEAHARFTRLADQYKQACHDLRELRSGAKTRVAEAIDKASAAALAGKKAPDPAALEQEIAREEVALRSRITVFGEAVDAAGNHLAEAIEANRDEYVAEQAQQAQAAAVEFEAALDAAADALARFAPCAGAVEWLEEFDLGRATVGAQQQFFGGRARLPMKALRDVLPSANADGIDAATLLAAARLATAPAPEPVTSTVPA